MPSNPFIKVDVKFDSKKNVNEKLNELLKSLKTDIKINIDTKDLDKTFGNLSRTLVRINKEIVKAFEVNDKISGHKKAIEELTNQQIKYQRVMGSSLDIGDGSKGFAELQMRAKEIRNTVDSLAKIDFQTTKNGQIKQATITYTDSMNKIVKETMAWKEIATDTQGVVKRVFTTTNVAISENIEKMNKLNDSFNNLKTGLQNKLGTAKTNSLIDVSVVENIQARLDKLNTNTAKEEIEDLINTINTLSKSEKQIVRLQNALESKKIALQSTTNKYGKLVGNKDSISDLNKLKEEIKATEAMIQAIQNGSIIDGTKVSQQINTMNRAYTQLNSSVKSSSEAMRLAQKDAVTFSGAMKDVFSKIGMANVAWESFEMLKRTLRQGVDDVIQMDSAMANLNKVVDLSASQLDKMRDASVQMGKELGRSSIEVMRASAEWGRQYKDLATIQEMTRTSLIGANVMDGVSADQVAKGMTTIISSMKLEAKDAIMIIDSLNEVQNKYRVEASQMMDALSNVGSTSRTAGLSLQQLEGYITALSVSTGMSGDEIGTNLKGIISRIYKVGSEGIESAGKPEKMLESMGVAVRDAGGQFRELDDILSDLNVKWKVMTNTQKLGLAQTVAGVHRYNSFIALMDNYQMSIDATATAYDSLGSAEKENLIYLNSIQGKIETMKTTVQDFMYSLIDSNSFKGLIATITGVVSASDWMIDKFGALPVVIGAVSVALLVFNKNFREMVNNSNIPFLSKISALFDKWRNSINNSALALKSHTVAQNADNASKTQATIVTGTYTLSSIAASLATGALTVATYALQAALTFGLAVAVSALIGAFFSLGDSLITTKTELKEMNQESVATTTGLSDSIVKAEELQKKIDSLNSKLGQTTSISERAKLEQELIETQSQLNDLLPETGVGIAENGKVISNNNAIVKESIRLKKEELKMNALEFADNNKNKNSIEEYKKAREKLNKMEQAYKTDDKSYETEYTQDYNGTKVNQKIKLEVDSGDIKEAQKEVQEMNEQYLQTGKIINALKRSGFNDLEIEDILSKEKVGEFKEYQRILEETDKSQRDLAGSSGGLKDSLGEIESAADKAKNSMKSLGEEFSSSSSEIEFINKVLSEYSENNSISSSTVEEMLKNYQHLLPFLADETTMVGKLSQQRDILKVKQYEQYQALITNAVIANNEEAQASAQTNNFIMSSTADAMNSLKSMYGIDVDNYTNAQNAKISVTEQAANNIANLLGSVFKAATSGITGGFNGVTITPPKINPPSLSNGGSSGSGGSGSSDKGKEEYKAQIDIYYNLKNAIDDVNDAIKLNREIMKNATPTERVKLQQREIELLKEQARLTQQLNDAQSTEAERLKRLIAAQGGVFDSTGNLVNYEKILQGSGDGIKNLEALIKEYTSLTQSEIPKCKEEWQELQNQIKELQKQQKEVVANTEKEIYDTVKYWAEKKSKAKKDEIDKQIDALNKLRNEEDKADDKASKESELADLQNQISQLELASDAKSKAKLSQLREEYKSLLEEFNKDIRDSVIDSNIDGMNAEKDALDKALEEFLDPANINKIIQDALQDGYATIGGEVVNLADLQKKMLEETTIGTTNLALEQEKYNDSLREAILLYQQIGALNSQVNNGRSAVTPARNTNDNNQSSNNTNNNNFDFTINITGVKEDSITDEMLKAVKKEFKEYTKNFKTRNY